MNPTESLFTIAITPDKLREIATEMEYYEKNSFPGQTVIYKLTNNFALQWTSNKTEMPVTREFVTRNIKG